MQVQKAAENPQDEEWQRIGPIQEHEPKVSVPREQITKVRLSQSCGASTEIKLGSQTNCSPSQELLMSHVLGQNWMSGTEFTWVVHSQNKKYRKLGESWKKGDEK